MNRWARTVTAVVMLNLAALVTVSCASHRATDGSQPPAGAGTGKEAGKMHTAMPETLRGVRKILFYGDSLTDGSDYPDYVVNTLRREFPEVTWELMNSALCGNTAADLRRRLQADVLDRRPDLVSICVGTNDCWQKRDVAAFAADMDALVAGLLAADVQVLLVKPSPFGKPEDETRFLEYLAVIDAVAARHRLPVADAHQVFLDGTRAGKEMLGPDGVHHGKDGFEGMARAVLDGLRLSDVAIEKTVRPWPWLLLDWETSAPVPNQEPYEPQKATGWQTYDRQAAIAGQPWWDAPFAARGGWMPFAPGKAPAGLAAYGRTRYRATRPGKAELRVGGSPPQIVWLNGREVWRQLKSHGYHPDADQVAVELQAGDNEIVVLSHYMAFVGIRPLDNEN